ncbi:restriction endonuclease subunit S [Helicobacter suis]|uniref:restriction endonuclease subunit S n=1 Tax=Helicobacter suis TaxID=104628 RepID=UPI000CF09048|nr:restriction endonuclease subunit S [Helicobacter suis]
MKEKRSNEQSPQGPAFKEALNTPTSEIKHLKQTTNLRECKKEQEDLHARLQNLPLEKALKELRVRGVEFVELGEVCSVVDYVANGSFKILSCHVQYLHAEDYAILVRLKDFSNGWRPPFVYINEYSYHFLKKTKLRPNDVVMCNIGSVGVCFKVPDLGQPMSLATNSILIRPCDSRLLSNFMFYFFKSKIFQKAITSITTQGAHPKFNKTDFKTLKIPLPPLFIQERIVTILDCLTELTAELTARKKQFHYYLNALLIYEFNASRETNFRSVEQTHIELQKSQDTDIQNPALQDGFNPPTSLIKHPLLKESFRVEWVRLGEIGEFVRGNGLTKADSHPANTDGTLVGAIHYGEIHTHYKTHTATTKAL